jgi:uncharacterized membrane protein YphA (DoxX/SURF4 family)
MMNTSAPFRYATVVFRVVLAVVFLIAGGSKIAHPWAFVDTIRGYNMLPSELIRPFGLALPWLEVMLGLYLLVGLFTRVSALVTAALLVIFLYSLSVQIARGHTGNCGCVVGINNPIVTAFVGGDTIGAWDLVRDSVLLLMALAVALVPRSPLALDRLLFGRGEEGEDEDLEDEPMENLHPAARRAART